MKTACVVGFVSPGPLMKRMEMAWAFHYQVQIWKRLADWTRGGSGPGGGWEATGTGIEYPIFLSYPDLFMPSIPLWEGCLL